ncbi:AAA family ATPase [Thiothrix subterranea]|uniref:AAA family ATPase n=1 Tax=Thiothrix subterranea TaxID=2735563 RepID=UPI00192B5502|nr:AAA family ATPase [Thiothrix subterranea]QQZ30396.1 AAA family ATPase [Thiothrix subterranea]
MDQNNLGMTGYFSFEGSIDPPKNVTFSVKDFGCIQKGEFQLKPLTIFCGKNNTGKTWAMYALYGVLSGIDIDGELPEIKNLANQLRTSGKALLNPSEWFERNFILIENIIKNSINNELARILNSSSDFFEESVFNYALNKEWSVKYFQALQINTSLADIGGHPVFHAEKEHQHLDIKFTLLDASLPDIEMHLKRFIFRHIAGERYLGAGHPFLLPAERNGLHLVFRELNFTRVQALHAGRIGSRELEDYLKRLSLYAKPIADYIDWLNTLSLGGKSFIKIITPMQELTFDIEKISGGSYEIDDNNKISFINNNIQTELHLSSSTANSLAGLWFFLNGNGMGKPSGKLATLMIDEPELNLHPSNQRAFARLISKLVNKGMRVVISTHSDYLIREINSLIMLSQEHPQRADLMEKYGYTEAEILKPEQVGAYLFDKNSIQTMEVSQEEGIIATTFDEVINDLNETSDDIFYTLKYGAGKGN